MDYPQTFRSIPDQFMAWKTRRPDAPAYAVRRDGAWQVTPWGTFVDEVRRVARAMLALGLDPGDKVGIIGFNRPEWTMFDLAAMAIRAVPVGVYTSCSPDQIAYILSNAEARLVLVEGDDAWTRLREARAGVPTLQTVVQMQEAPPVDDPMVLTWHAFLAGGDAVPDAAVDKRLAAIQPDDLASLIYTSGTTGPPKGSMLTHGNLWAATRMGGELLYDGAEDGCLVSYLPMAHAAERSLTLLGPAAFGYAVYYAESIEAMAANLKEVQPTVFLGVPRVWEKIHAALMAKLGEATGLKARIVRWARKVGAEVNDRRSDGRPISRLLAARYAFADRLLLGRIREAVGLKNGKALLSGAAPLAPEIVRDLASLDLPIREVYGQTEGSGPTSNNRPGETRYGSVGRPFHGVEVRIAEDGEVLIRGENVFAGYWRDPEATAEVLREGWLHTGDLGHLDEDGYLYITGRKKEILITAGGKNISPRNLEEAVKAHPLIQEAVVIGDRRRFLSVLLALDPEATDAWRAARGGSDGDFRDDPALRDNLWAHITAVNARFSSVEQLKKMALLPGPLTVESGDLTPTLKLRRSAIAAHYEADIEAMYA